MGTDNNTNGRQLTRGSAMADCRLGLGKLCVERRHDAPLLHRLLSLSCDTFWQETADGNCKTVLSFSDSTKPPRSNGLTNA